MHGLKKITLETIGGGEMIDRFQESLEKVLANILDDKMDISKPREIKLTLKLKPDIQDRKKVAYAFIIEEKLAPLNPLVNLLHIENIGSLFNAYEQEELEQGEFFEYEDNRELQIVKQDD